MRWALAALAFVLTAYVCRRILRLDDPPRRPRGLLPLPADLESIYRPVVEEVETQTVLLGITLNEALDVRRAGDGECAVAHMELAVSQWDRLTQIVAALLNSIAENLPQASSIATVRELTASQFRSRTMVDFMRGGAMLHQILFRSKPRYDFRIQVIRRAIEALSAELGRAYRSSSRMPSTLMWSEIDPIYHDYDLIVKEMLLALRDFLPALPQTSVPEFSREVALAISLASVRTSPSPASRRAVL